tara:strand:+ start:364 stop:588 length:225 start_codon:yes stop_codon:yes gene_type:complete
MTDVLATYETLETSELKQWYMNAYETRSCLGHWKHDRNRRLTELYSEELKKRGETIPSREDIDKHGIFNGEGSS